MSETRVKLEEMGFRILDAVRTELLLSMRFMAPALNSLGFKMDLRTSSVGTDAAYIRFNPGFLLQVYIERPRRMNRPAHVFSQGQGGPGALGPVL